MGLRLLAHDRPECPGVLPWCQPGSRQRDRGRAKRPAVQPSQEKRMSVWATGGRIDTLDRRDRLAQLNVKDAGRRKIGRRRLLAAAPASANRERES
jgi:hypothetical protein